jgi:hypothetical protein
MNREGCRSGWDDAGRWVGDGLRREVFFFRSRGVDLYGSLFAATEPSRPVGLVACNSWGVEADRSDALQRSVAFAMAKLGGAGMVFHYPGYGDSYGELASVDLGDLTQAATDAVAAAAERAPGISWILAGFMVGASVASLAQRQVGTERLLLVQPALRPGTYFRWLGDHGRRNPLRFGIVEGMAYGYPLPRRILERAQEADAAVRSAIEEFEGEGVVIRDEAPADEAPDLAPDRFERVSVAGAWRFGSLNHPKLAAATVAWLDRATAEVGANG